MNYIQQLQQVYSVGEARAIYRMVMELRFGLSHTDILLGKDTQLSASDSSELANIIARLLKKEPVQYVLGIAEFCGLQFHVTPDVLIPRPETEVLVDSLPCPTANRNRVLEIGTGSGCIAISLSLKGFHVTATDISEGALHVARDNAKRLNADVCFKHEDILHPVASDESWDFIVSNPPYICQHEAVEMEENVLSYEPHLALFVPDEEPLLFYNAIASYASTHLNSGGNLHFEINRAYAREVCDAMESLGFRDVSAINDQFGNPRVVTGIKP